MSALFWYFFKQVKSAVSICMVISGKSSLLAALHNREVPIPDHIDIFLLRREMPPSDKTALEAVIEVDKERLRLEKEAEDLGHKDDVGESIGEGGGACFFFKITSLVIINTFFIPYN